jgi:Tol biopolymer transport system component/DNA-binding winged helix-turn-helix (wHTH) protein
MSVAGEGEPVVRFGNFELDRHAGELRKAGVRLSLQPQPLRVLSLLLEHPGQVVTRDELRRQLWPDDTFVDFQQGLNAAVHRLRETLGDSADTPRFIETLPRRGYRFIGSIHPSDTADATTLTSGAAVTGSPTAQATAMESVFDRRPRGAWASAAVVLVAMAAAAAWWWQATTTAPSATLVSPAPVQRALTRLTFGPGLQTDVTFSPDGRFVAYASDRAGNFDIWVQAVTGGDPVQVTTSPAHDTQPAWSPDGSTLVFRSEREGGGLFLVPALGGVERQLTSFGSHPFWSSGGDDVLFIEARLPTAGALPQRLHVVAPGDRAPREILTEFFDGGDWFWIGGHPDGRISALGRHRQLGDGFYTVTRDGKEVVASEQSPDPPLRFTVDPRFDQRRFAWHPSGTALYVQALSAGVFNLWKVRVDPDSLAWVAAERLTTGAGRDVGPALSRDGTRLAFTTELDAVRLWLFPLNRVADRLGTGRPLTEDRAIASHASLSPDGRYVAYNLARPGSERAEARVTDVTDGTTERLPTDGRVARWSPDGQSIAFVHFRFDRTPAEAAVTLRHREGRERFISRWGSDVVFWPSDWVNEDTLLGSYQSPAFTGPVGLALWPTANPPADKPEQVLVIRPGGYLSDARLSPNGRWVSFVVFRDDRPGTAEIVVAPGDRLSPDGWTRIAADHLWPDKPRWSRDGRTLYFISRRPTSFFNLWSVRFDPKLGRPVGNPVALTAFDSPSMFISPEVHMAGMDVSSEHVVLTMQHVSGSIWMLDDVDK